MTAYGERLGVDAMGVQGSRARLAGMMAGGVWFRVVRVAVIIPADVDVSVLHSAVLGGVVRPLYTFGEFNSCELGVFRFQCFLILLLRLILNKHS